jgi:hypothetical protein
VFNLVKNNKGKLTDDQIAQLVAFIREIGSKN